MLQVEKLKKRLTGRNGRNFDPYFYDIFCFFVDQKLTVRCANIYGKGWTIFQKRMNPHKYPFNKKTWDQFKLGERLRDFEMMQRGGAFNEE